MRELIWRTVAQCWADRVLGLAAEAGFWALLSLTPLLLALVGAVGYLAPVFGTSVAAKTETRILTVADHFLAPSAVNHILRPVLADVLHHGHGKIVSIGFLLALWTGSTAMNTYVNAITIAYAMRDVRSALRARTLAFALYLGALITGSITLPLLVASPGWIIALTPARARPVVAPLMHVAYWPTMILMCTVLLATLYRAAVPVRAPWRRDLPGAIVAMLLWLAGSALLRLYLSFAITHSPTYGVLSAPIAALLFLYITALAILFGAELNSQIDRLHPNTRTIAARDKAARLQLQRLQ